MKEIFVDHKKRMFACFVFIFLSIINFIHGVRFDIWPSLIVSHPFGLHGLLEEVQNLSKATNIKPGDRIVLIGEMDLTTPLPLPMLGLVGNAPILSGLESGHVFEPMEPNVVGENHYYLSIPWRTSIKTRSYFKKEAGFNEYFRRIGVNTIISFDQDLASLPKAQSYTDRIGRTTYVVKIDDTERSPYPFHHLPKGSVWRSEDGTLRSHQKREVMVYGRPIEWEYKGNIWIGTPQTIPEGFAWGTIGLFGFVAWLLWRGLPFQKTRDSEVPEASS